jgi:CelD/BcsL family acetyltransferase involved in cellulose biosynthesis
MLKITRISDYSEFKDYRDRWEDLLSRTHTDNVFLTHDWIDACIRHVFMNEPLLILNVFDEDNKLIGIAPLMIRKRKYYNFMVRSICFIGSAISDRMDFILEDRKEEAIALILDYLMNIKERWDIIELLEIAEDTGTMEIIKKRLREKNMMSVVGPPSKTFYIKLDADSTKEDIAQKFLKRLKRKLGVSCIKKIKSRLEFKTCMNGEAKGLFNDIERIENQSWKGRKQVGIFSQESTKNFHKELFCRLTEKDKRIDLSILSMDKRPIAYVYSYYYNRRLYIYSIAFDERYSEFSPGTLLMNWKFGGSSAKEVLEFDLLRGDEPWKSRIAQFYRMHNQIRIFRNSFYPAFLFNLQTSVAPFVRTVKILHAVLKIIKEKSA